MAGKITHAVYFISAVFVLWPLRDQGQMYQSPIIINTIVNKPLVTHYLSLFRLFGLGLSRLCHRAYAKAMGWLCAGKKSSATTIL